MNYNDATKIKEKLGNYHSLKFPLKPLNPFPELLHINFKVVARNKIEFEEYWLTCKDSRIDPYQSYAGEFTVVVEFSNDRNNPTQKREINYTHFIRDNEWEQVLD